MRLFIFFVSFFVCVNAYSKVKVVDGDSLFIDNVEYRLSGIDAPEYYQQCYNARRQSYPCGKISKSVLQRMIDDNIRCDVLATDKYQRKVATCWVGETNINKKMVETGWAVAYKRYTSEYDEAESTARLAKIGIWQGRFLKPEFYRILQKEKNKAK